MSKNQFIASLKPGDTVNDIFVLSEKTLSQKKDGNNYLNLVLSDRTGNLKAVVWDNVDVIAPQMLPGSHVQVTGLVSEYRGMLQLVVRNAEKSSPDFAPDPTDFLPITTRNVNTMFERLVQLTDTLNTPWLQELFKRFWADDGFVQQFKTAPAAKRMHHAYLGGLLEHTLSMAILVDKIAGHYTGIDRDMLMAGAILHDIGKIREFEYSSHIDYTTEGRLISHIVIGVQMIDDKLKRMQNVPEDQAVLLKHLIVSHHGVREFGSPEVPKTIEAVLLNHIDEIDSKVKGIREFMASEDPGTAWTSYHKLLERQFYKGNPENGILDSGDKRQE